jgi:hypothetical protein
MFSVCYATEDFPPFRKNLWRFGNEGAARSLRKDPWLECWWVRYADAVGGIRREKAGVKSAAVKLYQKRKTEILEGKKLPEQLQGRVVRFAEIADDALAYCRAINQGQQFDAYRIGRLKDEFGNYAAEIPIEALREWFSEQEWQPGTHNRYKSTLSLMFRLAKTIQMTMRYAHLAPAHKFCRKAGSGVADGSTNGHQN